MSEGETFRMHESASSGPSIDCRCSGTPFEMGFSQGQAARPRVADVYEVLRHLEGFRLKQPAWLPYPLFLRLAEQRAKGLLVPALCRTDEPMLARLRGLAEGAAVPLRTVCLYNAMEAFLSSTEGVTAPSGCCSTVVVRGPRTRSGEPILARNFDYIPAVARLFLFRESRPQDGYRALEFTTVLHGGAIDGINENGLSIVQNYAFVTDSVQPAPLISMLISAALAACSTVGEAVDFIVRRHRWGAAILVVGDASADMAILELSNTRSAVRRAEVGTDLLLATNVYVCPETLQVQVPQACIYSDRAPRALRGVPVLDWHVQRMDRLQELVEAETALNPAELERIMADHGPEEKPGGASPCVHTEYWRTTACLQWYPARRRVRVSYGTACSADYVELAL